MEREKGIEPSLSTWQADVLTIVLLPLTFGHLIRIDPLKVCVISIRTREDHTVFYFFYIQFNIAIDAFHKNLEPLTGIEPASSVWKTDTLTIVLQRLVALRIIIL